MAIFHACWCSLALRLSFVRDTASCISVRKQNAGDTAAASQPPSRHRHVGRERLAAEAAVGSTAAAAPPALLPHSKQKGRLEALLAAVLFAAHPIHTEAVAGIVGHAELLCAALFVAALMTYMRAVSGAHAECSRAQWQLVAALALTLLAAFAKEIGITAVRV